MSNFDLEVFYSIIRQIVIDMAYEPGVSVNSFGVIDQTADVTAASYGYNYSDYENGYFWSRQWVLGGTSPETIKGQFPVIFVEEMEAGNEDNDPTKGLTQEVSLILVDKILCEACPPHIKRTGPAVHSSLKIAARAILQEAQKYELYDRGDELEWASPGRAATWPGGEPNTEDSVYNYIDLSRTKYRRWGNYPGLRGIRVNLTITSCGESKVKFRYDTPLKPIIGSTNCGC